MSSQHSGHAAKLVEIVSAAQNETKSAIADMKAAVTQRDKALASEKDANARATESLSQVQQVQSQLKAAKEMIVMKEADLAALREKHAKTVKLVRCHRDRREKGGVRVFD